MGGSEPPAAEPNSMQMDFMRMMEQLTKNGQNPEQLIQIFSMFKNMQQSQNKIDDGVSKKS